MSTLHYPEDDYEYEYYFQDEEDDYDPEGSCVECGHYPCADCCQYCGMPLCLMHFELGAGFCKNCPTDEWCEEEESLDLPF